MPPDQDDRSVSELVAAARAGDQAAWNALVHRFHRLVWRSVNSRTRDRELRNDAFNATWLRLAENLDKIRDPERLPGWLAQVARNEVSNLARREWRYLPTSDDSLAELPSLEPTNDEAILRSEMRRAVRQAYDRLSEACRELLALLVLDDRQLPYAAVAELVNRPIGALGPSRARCLEELRHSPEMARLHRERNDPDA